MGNILVSRNKEVITVNAIVGLALFATMVVSAITAVGFGAYTLLIRPSVRTERIAVWSIRIHFATIVVAGLLGVVSPAMALVAALMIFLAPKVITGGNENED